MPLSEPFIEIETYNFKELSERFKNSREHMLAAYNVALRKAGALLTPRIKAETPVGATHHLRNKTVYQVLGRAEDMRMEVRQSAFSERGFPYGVAVRHGTRPHFPPIDALVPWVRVKLRVAEDRVRQVAFLVARKISKVGTKPNPYHARVVDRSMGELKEIMQEGNVDFVVRLGDVPEVH
jgi:hypothetical protein